MYFSDLFPLVSSIFVFLLGFLVLSKNKKSRVNFTFFLHALSITVWLFATFMMFISRSDVDQVIFWDRIVYSGVSFIPVFMYHFGLAFMNRRRDFLLYLGYFLSFLFLVLSQTKYFVDGIFVYKWGVHTQAQFFHHIFLIYFVTYVVIWFIKTLKYYKGLKQTVLREQVKYIIIGFLLLFTIGPFAYLPAYGFGVYPFAYISGLVFTVILTYAIIVHRLMDIRIVAKKIFIYFGVAAFAYGTFYLLAWFYDYFLGGIFSIRSYLAGFVIAPLFVLGLYQAEKILKVIVNKYFFVSLYNYQETINKLTDELNHSLDLDKIVRLIVDTIKETMRLDRAGVLLVDQSVDPVRYRVATVVGFDKQNGISLVSDNFLTAYLKENPRPLVRDELKTYLIEEVENKQDIAGFKRLYRHMKKIEASLCLPLISNKKLIGIIVLGSKISADAYTKEDLELLSTLSKQAGIAIENASLYREIKKFNSVLEKEIHKATKGLTIANRKLRKIDKAKSEFISIASHQLRTPLTSIKGFTSLLIDGSYGDVSKEQKGVLEKVYISNERLIMLVEDLLNVSRIERGKLDYEFQEINVADLIGNVIKIMNIQARERKLFLKFENKASDGFALEGDYRKLAEVIGNLIDNAIKYTEKGGVSIVLSKKNNTTALIEITDTGVGIKQEEIPKLFEKFSRGEGIHRLHAGGTGLGLYVAKKMTEAHGGDIRIKSPGEGKGSTFLIELPLSQVKKISPNQAPATL